MALNWIRPYIFLNLDTNNRNTLANDKIFSKELRSKIKLLKTLPNAEEYLEICEEVSKQILESGKYHNFP